MTDERQQNITLSLQDVVLLSFRRLLQLLRTRFRVLTPYRGFDWTPLEDLSRTNTPFQIMDHPCCP